MQGKAEEGKAEDAALHRSRRECAARHRFLTLLIHLYSVLRVYLKENKRAGTAVPALLFSLSKKSPKGGFFGIMERR